MLTQVHGFANNLEIVWDAKPDGVNRGLERPAKLVIPHGLDDVVRQEQKLVCHLAWPVCRGPRRWVCFAIDDF